MNPHPFSLGILAPGKPARGTLHISNPGDREVVIATVIASCQCVSVAGLPAEVPPGKVVDLIVSFNPKEDPEFRGSLAVDLNGLAKDGSSVFHAKVEIVVESADAVELRSNSASGQPESMIRKPVMPSGGAK